MLDPRTTAPGRRASSRFYRWQRTVVWDRLLTDGQRQADAEGRLDWSLHFVDSTVVPAHQYAVGAKGGDPAAEAFGRSRGEYSTKIHLRGERGGERMVLTMTAGDRSE